MRERIVHREINPLLSTLPEKFQEIYSYQIDAIDEIVAGYDAGYRLVALEAPTGSGKTVIAECVRRMLKTRAVYVCHNKELQEQFGREFQYSKILFGRDNYIPPRSGLQRVTCGDCTWTSDIKVCAYCPEREQCPYVQAKMAAIRSPVPVLNSAYWVREIQGEKSRFRDTGMVVVDEADTLEGVLLGQVEVYVGVRVREKYGIEPPEKLTVMSSYLEWGKRVLDRIDGPIAVLGGSEMLGVQREFRRLVGLQMAVAGMVEDLGRDIPWVYTGGAGSGKRRGEIVSFRPVKVDRFGAERVWGRDKRFLVMAAVLPDITVSSLGWTEQYKRVTIPSQFHPKNRQVVVRPVADMTRKGMTGEEYGKLSSGVRRILSDHQRDRVLIHSVSYKLRDMLASEVGDSRRMFSFTDSSGRARAVAGFKQTAHSVLLAPGLERGLDLPGDQCRAQIIVKLPFPSLGDKQVSERRYKTGDGRVWYNQQVATSIVQMVGRGVRSGEDWCVAYILDRTWVRWSREWGHLLPEWFRKAVRIEW